MSCIYFDNSEWFSLLISSDGKYFFLSCPRHCKQYWISPGGNTPQSTNYMATCLPSRKLSKLDEPDMQDIAGEAETSS